MSEPGATARLRPSDLDVQLLDAQARLTGVRRRGAARAAGPDRDGVAAHLGRAIMHDPDGGSAAAAGAVPAVTTASTVAAASALVSAGRRGSAILTVHADTAGTEPLAELAVTAGTSGSSDR